MNKWRMKAGRFVDGECDLGVEVVWDMVTGGASPQFLANRLGISCEHLVRLAALACEKLNIPHRRRVYWRQMFDLQKERAPQG